MAVDGSTSILIAEADTSQVLTNHGGVYFSLAVTGIGAAATAWSVVLEGSLNGTNYTALITHADSDGNGVVLYSSTPKPFKNLRVRLASVTLGSATGLSVSVLAAGA